MTLPRPAVLFSEDEIARRIAEVGAEIASEFGGKEIRVVGLMKGCLVFMGDLIRALPLDLSIDLLRVSSLREGPGSPRTEIVYSTTLSCEGRDVLLLNDIIGTGITLSFVLDHMREHKPRSLKVCALIDRPTERKIDVQPDWALFILREAPGDRHVVGYGLDFAESYRGLPYLGVIPRPATPARGA